MTVIFPVSRYLIRVKWNHYDQVSYYHLSLGKTNIYGFVFLFINFSSPLKPWKMFTDINPFVPNAPFPYPLKTENRKIFSCFQGVEKGSIGNKWVKYILRGHWKECFIWISTKNFCLTRYWLSILRYKEAIEKRIKTYLTTKLFFHTSVKRKDFKLCPAGKYWIRARDRLQILLLLYANLSELINFCCSLLLLMISGGIEIK